METPEAPRKTTRKKEPSETPTDPATAEDVTADGTTEIVATPKRRPRKPKAAPELSSEEAIAAATDTTESLAIPESPTTSSTAAESQNTIVAAPDGPLVFTYPPVIPVKPETTTLSPISPAPNANDNEPELYKPLMAPPPQPTPVKPYIPPVQANPKPVAILRTVLLRNVEIGRKYSASAGKNLREQTGKLAEPIGNARGEFDKTLQRWHRSLETDDSAVVATTLIAIIVCVVLTLLVVALLQR